uniref:Uncharacterized protein n=1 Tax=Cynoglossus semilaevis TaxID=244447 RepID=A0A3P8VJ41_CYNSE
RGHGQEPRQEPDGAQGRQHGASGAQPAAGQRVHDGQVAVEAQAGEAEDAGVHVDQHHVAAHLAEGHAEGPVVAQGGVDGPEGQGHHQGQVGQGQVADVDVDGPALGFGPRHQKKSHTL